MEMTYTLGGTVGLFLRHFCDRVLTLLIAYTLPVSRHSYNVIFCETARLLQVGISTPGFVFVDIV